MRSIPKRRSPQEAENLRPGGRAGLAAAALFGALLGLGACTHVQRLPGLDAKLAESPDGYIQGKPAALERVAVLDNKDFVYGLGLGAQGTKAAFAHLSGKTFSLGLWAVRPEAKKLADVVTNGYEWDVEGVAFSPDGSTVATAGRDGVVRFYSAKDGTLLNEHFTDEPLVVVAFHPSGKYVIAGSDRGLLTLLSFPRVAFLSDHRAHKAEVRAIAATPDGRVVSGSWDKTVAVFELGAGTVDPSRVRLSLTQTLTPRPTVVVRAGLNGSMGLFAYDAALPVVVVSTRVAQLGGVDPSLLTETRMVMGHSARIAHGQTVNLKHVEVAGVDVAVCDECLPKEVAGILGAPVLSRFEIVQHPSVGELELVRKEEAPAATKKEAPGAGTAAEEGGVEGAPLATGAKDAAVAEGAPLTTGEKDAVAEGAPLTTGAPEAASEADAPAEEGQAAPAAEATTVLREVKRLTFDAFVNDLTVDRKGERLGVAFSHVKAERNREIYEREKRGEPAPLHEQDVSAIVDLATGEVRNKWRHHRGIVSTAAISPDGRSLATGGWDNRLYLFHEDEQRAVAMEQFGWILRRVRFSRDGRQLAVGAWTPQNAIGDQQSDPSAVVYDVLYKEAEVVPPGQENSVQAERRRGAP